jgi:uncharacterized protein YprB with RNaseH-like and TPR domain
MLKNTFCHIPGISVAAERKLWSAGVHSWEAATEVDQLRLPRRQQSALPGYIKESFEMLERGNPYHFAGLLPSNQHWRLFSDFRRAIAYLDIETTGLGYGDSITTIVLYDGQTIRHYVHGENLDEFKLDIKQYPLIVTYNGKCFDVPFIERFFRIEMNQSHIDLRYILKNLGYAGGLKGCERQLGIDRKDLADVDGYFAVLLWNEFERKKNPKALETLLAYNTADVVNLETLMVMAYNMNLKSTPFYATHRLASPASPEIRFKADREIINRLKRNMTWGGYGYSRGY